MGLSIYLPIVQGRLIDREKGVAIKTCLLTLPVAKEMYGVCLSKQIKDKVT